MIIILCSRAERYGVFEYESDTDPIRITIADIDTNIDFCFVNRVDGSLLSFTIVSVDICT